MTYAINTTVCFVQCTPACHEDAKPTCGALLTTRITESGAPEENAATTTTTAASGTPLKVARGNSHTVYSAVGIISACSIVRCDIATKREWTADVPYDPQPREAEVLWLTRHYATQKGADYRKRVSWITGGVTGGHEVALVEYVGEPQTTLPHGKAKVRCGAFTRTPVDTMDKIAADVKGASCKETYGKVVAGMDVDDAPRDSRVVRNKKYNEAAKSRSTTGSSTTVTFADEIQQVCSLVSHDDFVQSVTLSSARVPCVTQGRWMT